MTATRLRYEAEVLRQGSVHPTGGLQDRGDLRRV